MQILATSLHRSGICDCIIWLKLQASGLCKHLAFAIIMDDIELPPDGATLDPHHQVSNEAGGQSSSSLSYGASSSHSCMSSSQIQRANSMGGQGDQSWQAASSGELQPCRSVNQVTASSGSSVGPSSSAIRARINEDIKRNVERNNARMVEELNSIQATSHPHVIVLRKDGSGELEPCRLADEVTASAKQKV